MQSVEAQNALHSTLPSISASWTAAFLRWLIFRALRRRNAGLAGQRVAQTGLTAIPPFANWF